MRSPVYRNLDRPFEIYGFTPLELGVLVFIFVGGGELAQALGIPRAWAFVFTAVLALSFHGLRRSLGGLFGRRLWRFLGLPSELNPRLFSLERRA